jgi:RimJ/RimL family protein N-acetyltransferase
VPDTTSAPLNWKAAAAPQPIVLSGRYVTLEPLDGAQHGSDLWEAVHGHDHIWTWLSGEPKPNPAALIADLELWQKVEKAVLFAIVPTDTGRAAGWASYMRITPAHGVIEVGNILYSPKLQQTRAATEAMYLMARHVFEDLGYRRYEWKCNTQNAPSRRAALRLGFTFEGVFRQHMVAKGYNRDTAWFSLLDHEWAARKQAFEGWLAPANFDETGRQRQTLAEFAEAPIRPPA